MNELVIPIKRSVSEEVFKVADPSKRVGVLLEDLLDVEPYCGGASPLERVLDVRLLPLLSARPGGAGERVEAGSVRRLRDGDVVDLEDEEAARPVGGEALGDAGGGRPCCGVERRGALGDDLGRPVDADDDVPGALPAVGVVGGLEAGLGEGGEGVGMEERDGVGDGNDPVGVRGGPDQEPVDGAMGVLQGVEHDLGVCGVPDLNSKLCHVYFVLWLFGLLWVIGGC